MKLHTLYQTINRNWKNPNTGQKKLYGLIVDYVGLVDVFDRAMSPANPNAAQKEVDFDSLIDQFETELANILDRFVGIDRNSNRRHRGGHASPVRCPIRHAARH